MAIPPFHHFMIPLLKLSADGKEHTAPSAGEVLAEQLGLSADDIKERLPSGGQSRFDNRISWSFIYLSKAGLLERIARGRYRITDRGREVLKNPPVVMDKKFLDRFPEFVEFNTKRGESAARTRIAEPGVDDESREETPEETLESSYQHLRRALAQELLDRVKGASPRFFESLVVDLLVAMGYGGSRRDAGQAIGQSGDDGIDGIIKEDKLGLDAVYIQAKRWQGSVGRPVVQAFAGSLEGQRARKGVLITTSSFTSDADEYVKRIEKRIVLIDGVQLAQFMIDHGIGVTEVATYVVKKTDADYFGEE